MQILVISDTHDLLREAVIDSIHDSDAVIHAGDIASDRILKKIKLEMKQDSPLFVVRGNNDRNLLTNLHDSLSFELFGLKFFVVHNKRDIPEQVGADIVIYGHSHKYACETINNQMKLMHQCTEFVLQTNLRGKELPGKCSRSVSEGLLSLGLSRFVLTLIREISQCRMH